ncbi:MAG: Zn-dependent alcohol dehydrogenase [Frankiaceae bacterium]|nr:Zn-dependent alcohol dehydrogenase [Frankiaceae bacterium]
MAERAAVLRAVGAPMAVEEICLLPLAEDQVRVRIKASGVCHSDLSLANGDLPFGTPAVLGHEGAGVIEEIGAAVTHVEPGDHVIIAWTAACGECWFCARGEVHLCDRAIADAYSMPYAIDVNGNPLIAAMGVSSFATATNCLGRAVVKIDPSIPFEIAALVGCGVATGAGAAMNTAPVRAGSSVAVFGLGGVGLAAVLGAVVQGAGCVIVVDPVAERRTAALTMGATDAIDPAADDVVKAIKRLTERRGVDFAFEAVGRGSVVEQAYAATRKGGTTCVVGAARPDDSMTLSPFEFMMGARSLVGCQYGSTVPARDFPLLLDLWRQGRMPLERLVTNRINLEDIDSAFADMKTGHGVRSVICND